MIEADRIRSQNQIRSGQNLESMVNRRNIKTQLNVEIRMNTDITRASVKHQKETRSLQMQLKWNCRCVDPKSEQSVGAMGAGFWNIVSFV